MTDTSQLLGSDTNSSVEDLTKTADSYLGQKINSVNSPSIAYNF